MNRLIIIGAGGHGRVAADIGKLMGYTEVAFLDDHPSDTMNVVGKTTEIEKFVGTADFFVGIGDNAIREKFQRKLETLGASIATLIHPTAVVASDAVVGRGTILAAGSIVCVNVTIGDGVIVNTAASVDHDCTVGDFCHVSVGSHVCGTVHIGNRTWIGAGATVIHNVDVGNDCMVGAGAVVVRSITDSGLYKGVPAIRDTIL